MNLRTTFQSVIALHQEELPYDLIDRNHSLPTNKSNIVTVTGDSKIFLEEGDG